MKVKFFLAASLAIATVLPSQAQMFFGKPKVVSDSAYIAQAQTPPMGWNSWNKFGCNVSEKLIMEMADKMVETGMKDAEMLEVGNGGMTKDEYITHFSMWCMLAAPLMAGNDLSKMDKDTHEILTNKEVIAVDQDPMGEQGRRFMDMGDHQIWAKPLANGELAVCFMNRSEFPWKLDYNWRANTIYYANEVNIHHNEYKIRDLWQHKDIGTTAKNTKTTIPGHGVLMVRLSKVGENK